MPELYKVLMFGDRNWSNWKAIEREMTGLVQQHGTTHLVIISGMAPGADVMAAETAREWDVHCVEVPALWATRHRSAGPQRNAIMAALQPDEGIGFHENISKSKGTKDMRKRLEKADIPVRIVKR